MEIHDIKTPGFITEPRLMGEQNDNDGTGKIHYSCEALGEVAKANYYKNAQGDLYYRSGENWYVLKDGKYQSCPEPFRSSD